MGALRRSREPAAYASIEGFPVEALVVRGPRGAVSYEDQRYGGGLGVGLGFRQVLLHRPVAAGEGESCARLDGVDCSPDSAACDVVDRWTREGAFDSDEATFALLERQYEAWLGGEAS